MQHIMMDEGQKYVPDLRSLPFQKRLTNVNLLQERY